MPSPVASRLITDQIAVRLSGVTTLYRGEVPDPPPLLTGSDRVAPYAVLYPFPGKPGPANQTDLAWSGVDLDYGCQVSCVAGFETDCEFLVDTVHPLLFRFSPVVAGVVVGMLAPPPGFDPGPVRINRSVLPPRFSVPLQYRLTATAN